MTSRNILLISGSLRPDSAHKAILEYLQSSTPEHQLNIFNGLEDIPNFNPAKDDDVHTAVAIFRKALTESDAVLICTPEYAYGIPGALKNALDWTVSSGSFVDKPVAIITASGLGEHAHASMKLVMTALNSKFTDDTTLLISWLRSKMNEKHEITDVQIEQDIRNVLKALIDLI